jgi:hypothetical protein
MVVSSQTENQQSVIDRAELLRVYAEQDAVFGSPNPRYKQCKLYCDRYLDIRIQLVGIDGLTDTDWDLTIF